MDKDTLSRKNFVKGAVAGSAAFALSGALKNFQAVEAGDGDEKGAGQWVPTTCQGCTSWCSLEVLVQDGRAVRVRGNPRSKVNLGRSCPRSHLALQQVYDPDRLKTPMKRTNPRKGKNEDPGFVPISWDEALDMVADRIMKLRHNGETHKFLLMRGRYSAMRDILYSRLPAIIGSPNNISHSAICAEAEKFGAYYTEGLWDYRQYDVKNARYVLLWGADPVATNRQVSYYVSIWGDVLDRAKMAVVDPRHSASAAKADEWLPIRPGQDGALAVAIAHVILAEGLWNRNFAGDFRDGENHFTPGDTVDEESFEEKYTHGIAQWWNLELKDKTPQWAEKRTGLHAAQIERVARGFAEAGSQAICWVGGGPVMQVRGGYSAMAAHALNGLVGSSDSKGGVLTPNPAYIGSFPPADDDMDGIAEEGLGHPKIDWRGTRGYPSLKGGKSGGGVVTNRVADSILEEDPYDIKVAIGYYNNFAFSCPQAERWERAMAKVPFSAHITTHVSEQTWFADVILPAKHHMCEKWAFSVGSPANGYRQVSIMQPVIEPMWDVKADETEIPWLLAEKLAERGFDKLLNHFRRYRDPETGKTPENEKEFELFALKLVTRPLWDPARYKGGDRINGWDEFVRRGVWNSDPYTYRKRWGRMNTETSRFEFYSETLKKALTDHADAHNATVDDILTDCNYQARGERAFVPHYEEPFQWGDEREYPFELIDSKSRVNREGRTGNSYWYYEMKDIDPGDSAWDDVAKINPEDGRRLGIEDGEQVVLRSPVGKLTCRLKYWEGVRHGTIAKTYGQGHWVYGRVAAEKFGRKPRGGNNNDIIPADYDRLSGSTAFYAHTRVKVEKA